MSDEVDEAYSVTEQLTMTGINRIRQKINVHGIPVYHDVGDRLDLTGSAPHELIKDAWKRIEPIMGISDNRFEFMGDDSFEMLVRWVKEVGITKEDVPLAPLSSIISSIEGEIQKGHIRKVYALRLGYGCYITNESPETYLRRL